jgi:hypothetical protein
LPNPFLILKKEQREVECDEGYDPGKDAAYHYQGMMHACHSGAFRPFLATDFWRRNREEKPGQRRNRDRGETGTEEKPGETGTYGVTPVEPQWSDDGTSLREKESLLGVEVELTLPSVCDDLFAGFSLRF